MATIADQTTAAKAYFDLTGPFSYVYAQGAIYIFDQYDNETMAAICVIAQSKEVRDTKGSKKAYYTRMSRITVICMPLVLDF